jgi:Protein of unknown function (DUF3093)
MRNYREQLYVPISYWLLGLVSVTIIATTIWAGFSVWIAIATYVIIVGGWALFLFAWGSLKIQVSDGSLRAGRALLPLSRTGAVTVLDEAQTRAMRGPRADPAAFLLIRPYLKLAVYIEVTGTAPEPPAARSRPAGRWQVFAMRIFPAGRRRSEPAAMPPYWLVASRRPAELAAAIERSRPAARTANGPVA